MLAASRPETIREPNKTLFVNLVEDRHYCRRKTISFRAAMPKGRCRPSAFESRLDGAFCRPDQDLSAGDDVVLDGLDEIANIAESSAAGSLPGRFSVGRRRSSSDPDTALRDSEIAASGRLTAGRA
jgi:hypothetical protein